MAKASKLTKTAYVYVNKYGERIDKISDKPVREFIKDMDSLNTWAFDPSEGGYINLLGGTYIKEIRPAV